MHKSTRAERPQFPSLGNRGHKLIHNHIHLRAHPKFSSSSWTPAMIGLCVLVFLLTQTRGYEVCVSQQHTAITRLVCPEGMVISQIVGAFVGPGNESQCPLPPLVNASISVLDSIQHTCVGLNSCEVTGTSLLFHETRETPRAQNNLTISAICLESLAIFASPKGNGTGTSSSPASLIGALSQVCVSVSMFTIYSFKILRGILSFCFRGLILWIKTTRCIARCTSSI